MSRRVAVAVVGFLATFCAILARRVGGPDATPTPPPIHGQTITLCETSTQPVDGAVLHLSSSPCWLLEDSQEWARFHQLALCPGSVPAEGRRIHWHNDCWEVQP